MCRSMVDIQFATAEIRRGKKIEITGQKYNGLPYYIGDHNKFPTTLETTTTLPYLYHSNNGWFCAYRVHSKGVIGELKLQFHSKLV